MFDDWKNGALERGTSFLAPEMTGEEFEEMVSATQHYGYCCVGDYNFTLEEWESFKEELVDDWIDMGHAMTVGVGCFEGHKIDPEYVKYVNDAGIHLFFIEGKTVDLPFAHKISS